MAKEKMSIEKKTKLIYSGELVLFAIIFFVIATLEVLGVIGKREIMMIIFNWITIFGGTWMLVDFFWTLFSKKRRKKNSLLDKAMLVPAAIYVITFDILCFCQLSFITIEFRRLMMGILFYYFGACYLFQGIYHYFFPVPAVVNAIEETYKAIEEEQKQEEAKNNPEPPLENEEQPQEEEKEEKPEE